VHVEGCDGCGAGCEVGGGSGGRGGGGAGSGSGLHPYPVIETTFPVGELRLPQLWLFHSLHRLPHLAQSLDGGGGVGVGGVGVGGVGVGVVLVGPSPESGSIGGVGSSIYSMGSFGSPSGPLTKDVYSTQLLPEHINSYSQV